MVRTYRAGQCETNLCLLLYIGDALPLSQWLVRCRHPLRASRPPSRSGRPAALSRPVKPAGTLYMYTATKNPIYVSLLWELRGLSPKFHIHVSVSDL
jgi:hypothetical protein